jgi:hypothetical protein
MTDIPFSTLRQSVFAAINAMLIANKPTYTFNGTLYTYSIVAEYPSNDSVFPCIVLNKAVITPGAINMDASGIEITAKVKVDIYSPEKHGKKAIDVAMDKVMDALIDNKDTLKTTYGILLDDDFFDESNSTVFEDKKQILNTVSAIIKVTIS